DKVSVEVPSPATGTLTEILAESGTTVAAGAIIARITGNGAGRPAAPKATEAAAQRATAPAGSDTGDIEDAPSATKLMAEKGISRDQVKAGGGGGRVMKGDVLKAIAEPGKPETPQPATAPSPPPPSTPAPRAPVPAEDAAREERVRMTRLRQTIARRLKEAQNTAAMLTTYNEVDMTAVMELRSAYK